MSFIMRPIRFASTGFVIAGSGLFDGSSGYLARTPGSAGTSNKKFTIEVVFKPKVSGATERLASSGTDSNDIFNIQFEDTGQIIIGNEVGGSNNFDLRTTQLFRDSSAFAQLILAVDTSQATASNRAKVYWNGTRITDFATETYPSEDLTTIYWNQDDLHHIGATSFPTANFWSSYIARFTNIDGLQLDASSFGETTDDGFWQINDASELTFGNNGFLLEGQSIAAGTDSNVTGYSPGSVVFSGTPYITRGADLTGISDGNTGLISAWVKFGSDGSSEYLWGATTDNNEIQVYRRSDNTLWVNIQDTGNNGDLFLKTSETITVASGWTHLLISWDVSAGYSDIYINDSQSSLSLDTTTSGGLDYTHSNHNFFASDSGDSSEVFNGEAADFWLTVNQTRFELTTESNRRKFISSDGYAVDLGSDGSTPTGTAPLVFFHLDRGEAATAFFANAGTGGTTSLSSSSLTEGSDPNNRHFTPAGTITATNDSPTNGDA